MALDRPLNISLVHTADSGGGAETVVMNLHRALQKLGHCSRLFVGRKHTDEAEVYEIKRRRTLPGLLRICQKVEMSFGLERLYAPWFRRLDKDLPQDTDVLHIHSLWGAESYADVGGIPGLTRRFPTIMTLHESWLLTGHCACPLECERWKVGCGNCPDLDRVPRIPRDGTKTNWLRKYHALQRSEVSLTTPSDWLREMALQSPITQQKTISVIPNGYDENVYKPGAQEKARHELGLSADSFVLLLLGKNLEHGSKGTSDVLTALRGLQCANLVILAVGEGSQHIAKKAPCPVVALPLQRAPENLAKCYIAADLTVFPSYSESFGMVPVESQACGTPVVAYSSGGVREVLKEGVGGILAPTGDIVDLGQKILELYRFPETRLALGRSGADWVCQNFSSMQMARAFVNKYKKLFL